LTSECIGSSHDSNAHLVFAVPRMRKGVLDDAKKNAENAAKKRDEANANPKRKDIPIEITSLTNKMEDIRIKLENDKSVQAELLQLQEHQIQIQETKKNAESELNTLQEDIRVEVNADTWRGYNLSVPPTELPKQQDDKLGEKLKRMMNEINRDVSARFEEKENELLKMNDDITRLTQLVSEQKALLQQDALSVSNKKARLAVLQGNVDQIKLVLQEVRAFENSGELAGLGESKPQELLDYLLKRLNNLEMESAEGVPTEMIRKVMGSLFKLVSRTMVFRTACLFDSFSHFNAL
jgi:DNA repair protein RAD50